MPMAAPSNRPTEKASFETDVLVVGAGPTGLMLANQLGRRGVRARIIDRHTGPSVETRADRKSTRLNSSHVEISYAVFCLKKKKKKEKTTTNSSYTNNSYRQPS